MSKQKAEGVVSEDLSKKILSQARHQLEEDMEEDVEEMNIDHVPKKAASKYVGLPSRHYYWKREREK
jgi:hypothetical protein